MASIATCRVCRVCTFASVLHHVPPGTPTIATILRERSPAPALQVDDHSMRRVVTGLAGVAISRCGARCEPDVVARVVSSVPTLGDVTLAASRRSGSGCRAQDSSLVADLAASDLAVTQGDGATTLGLTALRRPSASRTSQCGDRCGDRVLERLLSPRRPLAREPRRRGPSAGGRVRDGRPGSSRTRSRSRR